MRGRIGRGEQNAWCVLVTGKNANPGDARLETLVRSSDGFEIAEADWEFRGPGDMVGTAQSGLPPLRVGDLRRDAELMHHARSLALGVFAADPMLEQSTHAALRSMLAASDPSDNAKPVVGSAESSALPE
jgi:ATP-dependent DNA helicase RecG